MSLFYLLNNIILGYKQNLKNICINNNNICSEDFDILISLQYYNFIESFFFKLDIDSFFNNNLTCIINLKYNNFNKPLFLHFYIFKYNKKFCNIKYKNMSNALGLGNNKINYFFVTSYKFKVKNNINLKIILHIDLLRKRQGGVLFFCIW